MEKIQFPNKKIGIVKKLNKFFLYINLKIMNSKINKLKSCINKYMLKKNNVMFYFTDSIF